MATRWLQSGNIFGLRAGTHLIKRSRKDPEKAGLNKEKKGSNDAFNSSRPVEKNSMRKN
jgi:hypothetical protein